MAVFFFNREIESPVLKAVIATGAVLFAFALAAILLVVILPVIGAVLTGVFLLVCAVLLILLVTVPFLCFLGILFSNRRKGSGVAESRAVVVEPFTGVRFSGTVNAVIVCGQPQSLTVTTDSNLIDDVKIAVEKGELTVSYPRSVCASKGIKLEIAVEQLKSLCLSGAGKALITELNEEELFISASGAAGVTASGKCRSTQVKLSGAGKFNLENLISETVKLSLSGAAKAVVHATTLLDVKISGAGNVVCFGNPPSVKKHISGAGKLEMK
jgi:hypothetical protein